MKGWRGVFARKLSAGWGVARRVSGLPSGFRVLMYHAVGTSIPEDRLGFYTISPSLFLQQMRIVASDGSNSVVSLSESVRGAKGVAITFDDGYRDGLTVAAPILAELGLPFTVFVSTAYVRSGNELYLSESELQELAQFPGATIGSHGVSHVKLTECSDLDLRKEVNDSRSYLEDVVQRPITTLSYPHGAFDSRVQDAVGQAGYVLAACSRFGTNFDNRDPLALKRTDIWGHDEMDDFQSKIDGNWDWMQWKS